MGNSQVSSVFSRKDDQSIFSLSSNNVPSIILYITELQKTFHIEATSTNIPFSIFRKELERELRLPTKEIKYYVTNITTKAREILKDDTLLSSITQQQISIVIGEKDIYQKLRDITFTVMRAGTIEVVSIKAFNFMPLKYALLYLSQTNECFRLFQGTDLLLTDPLDLEKSLADYKLDGEDEVNLILYYPHEADKVKVDVINNKGAKIFEVDQYMRISQLAELYNKETNGFCLLCDPKDCMKIYENYTIAKIAQEKKHVLLVAQDFDDYYSKFVEPEVENYLEKDEVKTKFLELPD